MQVLSTSTKLRNPIFGVDAITVQNRYGEQFRRMVVTHQGSAVVVPMNKDGAVLLVSQWRAPLRASIWELPAGRIDEGETPLKAARRELAEETGLRARVWKRIARLHPSPGYVSELMHLYLATSLSQGESAPEGDEDIRVRWFARQELEQWIDAGRFTDAKTIAGVLMAWRFLDRQVTA